VVAYQPRGHACGLGDPTDRRLVEATLAEMLDRGVPDPSTSSEVLRVRPGRRHVVRLSTDATHYPIETVGYTIVSQLFWTESTTDPGATDEFGDSPGLDT
jgi:hypothetical protein